MDTRLITALPIVMQMAKSKDEGERDISPSKNYRPKREILNHTAVI